ncbi:MAG: DUF4337 domain-containing protein [Candidatus Kapabacteria bacterium]|nr:DUF4337 domain-containing protein [Candidatus Kapabacteria bacterium]
MEDKIKEAKEIWTTYLAITTVLIAVCATLSTFKGGGYSTRSLMNQTNASNQWAYYQAKSIKSSLVEMQKDKLDIELNNLIKISKDQGLISEYQKKVDTYNQKIKKYEVEKQEIYNKAKEFEVASDDAKKHSEIFGIAVIFLQVSILLSSIAALTKKKFVWIISLGISIFGFLYFANGFFLMF